MGLYERLTQIGMGANETPIHVHQFMAALGEIERGKMTAQQAIDGFALTSAEQADAVALIARIVSPLEALPIGGRIVLTNIGTTFVTLGFASIQTAGIRRFELACGINRNGAAGNLEFQLADVTSGVSQQLLITDVAGSPAGERFITGTRDYDPALGAGIARIALRARSTTNTDDPIHLGSSLLVRRQDRLTSNELHEILLLAQDRIAPLNSVAAVKLRLGV